MKKTIIFELSWLAGLLVVAFLISLITANRALDINMHDTYIMIDGHAYTPTINSYPAALYIVILCLVYFVRCLAERFADVLTNIVLFISTGIVLFFFGDIVMTFTALLMHFAAMFGLRHWFYYLRIVLMVILVLDVFMIGRNWRILFNRNK